MKIDQRISEEVSKYPVLLESELNNLFFKMHNGNNFEKRESKDKIFQHNMRLVILHMRRMPILESNATDAFQEGCIGLIKGIEKYNSELGASMSTYVSYWIKAYLKSFIRNSSKLIRLPISQTERKLFSNYSRVRARLLTQGLDCSDEIIAKELSVSLENVKKYREMQEMQYCSMQDENNAYLMETLSFEDNSKDIADLVAIIYSFRESLSNNHKIVFDARVIQTTFEIQEDVGKTIGVTKQRVQQIEYELIEKLKKKLKSFGING